MTSHKPAGFVGAGNNTRKREGNDMQVFRRAEFRCSRFRRARRRGCGLRANAGAVLQGQDRRYHHRLPAGRQQRHLRAAARPPHRQAHSRQSQHRAEEHAGRRQLPGLGPRLQYRAKGRHDHRHRRADLGARREARHAGRPLQDCRAELGRPHRLAGQHRVLVEDLAGQDHCRRAADRIDALGHRAPARRSRSIPP